MNIKVRYVRDFVDDMTMFNDHERALIRAAVLKIRENPFKLSEGGVGKVAAESGNESILSVKIAAASIRIVYKLIKAKDGESALVIFASAVNDATPRAV